MSNSELDGGNLYTRFDSQEGFSDRDRDHCPELGSAGLPTTEMSLTPPLSDESLLWGRADELYGLRTGLAQHQSQLFEEVSAMHARRLNLYEQEQLGSKQDEYWRISRKIEEIQAMEDRLTQALQDLEAGTLDKATLEMLAPQPTPESEKISKKKQRIREERERLGIDPREVDYDLYRQFGATSTTHLNTGRHQTHIRGNIDPAMAESEFFYYTADTHGGKVAYGKERRRGFYTAANGQKVRKR